MSALLNPVLVLNKNWAPLDTCTMKKALKKVIGGRAKVVNPEDYQTLSWEDWAALRDSKDFYPEIIILNHYDKIPQPKKHFNRRTLFKRDGYKCQYCSKQLSSEECTIDHVIPSSRGGKTDWLNCVIACVPCNTRKGSRTPEEANMKLQRIPTIPKYTLLKAPAVKIKSWSAFISELYWMAELKD